MPGLYTFALTVQQLARRTDQVLVLGELQSTHTGKPWFRPADITALYSRLRLPAPGNLHQVLSDLASKGMVRRSSPAGEWAITPLGRERVSRVGVDLNAGAVEAEASSAAGGATLGGTRHPVVPPFLAPPQYLNGLSRFLSEHPFETNVFGMTRFPRETATSDPNAAVLAATREALRAHGLELHLASERQIVDDVYGNVAAHMWACMYGVAVLETRLDSVLNHNVVIEVGSMLMTGRRCVFLRDSAIAAPMPTDLVGQIYKSVDFDDVSSVGRAVHEWTASDIGRGRCAACPPLEEIGGDP